MSKELIDRLKSYIPSGDGHNSQYANDLADAVAILEAKAVPVSERDDERAAIHQLAFELGGTEGGEYLLDADDLDAVIDAAYQRQSGVVMPEPKPEIQQKDKRGDYPSQDCYNDGAVDGWNACLDELARLNGGSHE